MRGPDPFAEVQLVGLRTLRGANLWAHYPVTRMDLAVGAYEEIHSADVGGLAEALAAALPGLVEHRCNIGERGGFLTRLRRGTYLPHILEHLALELQSAVGHHVGFGRARGGDRPTEYTVVFEHRHTAVGRRAGILALDLAQRAFAGAPVSAAEAIDELMAVASSPDAPALRRAVMCGITGEGDRQRVRAELVASGAARAEDVVEMPPSAILDSGLPYSASRVAVILDAAAGDVPARYREPELARRLVSVVADAVPRGGTVIAPADEPELHALIVAGGRVVAAFQPDGSPARRAAALAARILTDNGANVGEQQRERG